MMDAAANGSGVAEEGKVRPFLPFRNFLVFGRVMRDPEMAKELLERILGIGIERVEYCNTEQALTLDALSKGVRLDLYVKDGSRIFNVEMQCGNYDRLGERMARYQTQISSESAPARGSVGIDAPESYVIFLCADDPFDRGRPRYDFEMRCRQAEDLVLYTGFHWLALNAQAYEEEPDERLRNVLRHVRDDEVTPGDAFVERMDSEVHRVNRDKEWVDMVDYLLTYKGEAEWEGYIRGKDEGLAEGLAEGEAKGRAEGFAEGETRLSALIGKLLNGDRIEDAKRATTDDAYRRELFKEFGIA